MFKKLWRKLFRVHAPMALPPPVVIEPQHELLVIDPQRIQVRHYAEVPRKSPNPSAITVVAIDLRGVPPVGALRDYYVASYLTYPNEYRGWTADEARANLLALFPRGCDPACVACQLRAQQVFDDHEEDFGPYLGSLGGLDTELVERRPPTMPTADDFRPSQIAPYPFGRDPFNRRKP